MVSYRIRPIQEYVKIIKQFSAFIVRMIQFFDFSICLRVLDTGQDMLNLVVRQELAESAFRFSILVRFVGKKL
jgi:hypothetical protein